MTRRAFAIFIVAVVVVGVALAQVPGIFTTVTATSYLEGSNTVIPAGSTGYTGSGNVVLSGSPALTGTPTAPTASPGTNTTQIATTAFVQSSIAGVAQVQGYAWTTGFCTTGGAEQKCSAGPFNWPNSFTGTYYVTCNYTGVSGSGTNPGMYPVVISSVTSAGIYITEQAGSNSAGGTNTPTGMYCIGVQP